MYTGVYKTTLTVQVREGTGRAGNVARSKNKGGFVRGAGNRWEQLAWEPGRPRCGKSGEGGGGDCDERPSRAALKGGHRRNEESRGCGGEECDQMSDKLQEWQGDAIRVKDGEKLGGGGGAEPRVAERNRGLRPTVCFAHKQPR